MNKNELGWAEWHKWIFLKIIFAFTQDYQVEPTKRQTFMYGNNNAGREEGDSTDLFSVVKLRNLIKKGRHFCKLEHRWTSLMFGKQCCTFFYWCEVIEERFIHTRALLLMLYCFGGITLVPPDMNWTDFPSVYFYVCVFLCPLVWCSSCEKFGKWFHFLLITMWLF